jgi:hypothetical protein
MKKKLEAELISIAHRILKLKNKSDLVQLHQETLRLYEKLSVLRFVEDNFSDVKPTIGYSEIEDKLTSIFDSEILDELAVVEEVKADELSVPEAKEDEGKEKIEEKIDLVTSKEETVVAAIQIPQPESKESNSVTDQIERSGKAIADLIKGIRGSTPKKEIEILETAAETIAALDIPEEVVAPEEVKMADESKDEVMASEENLEAETEKIEESVETDESKKQDDFFKPAFEWSFDAKPEEPKDADAKITPAQISFEDLLGESYTDPVFVKPEDLQQEKETIKPTEKSEVISISRNLNDTSNVISINKSETINDRASKGIIIGLNDRIAFMNHLFNNSSEDYNRVLSQLMTLDNMGEATNFIDTMVKPDYNNWVGKEDYEERFMEIIEKKFS